MNLTTEQAKQFADAYVNYRNKENKDIQKYIETLTDEKEIQYWTEFMNDRELAIFHPDFNPKITIPKKEK